jgi:hypothetical protein
MKTNFLCALALLAIAAAPASAEIKKHPTAKVEIDVPTGWKMASPKNEPDVLTLTDPTNEVGMIFIVTDSKDLKKVVEELDKRLANVATDIKWAFPKPQSDKLNGMEALYNKGNGKVNGKDADLGLVLLHTPSDKILLIFDAVETAKKEAHKAEISKLVASIKPST